MQLPYTVISSGSKIDTPWCEDGIMEEDRPPSNLSFGVDEIVKNALERASQAVMNETEDDFPDYEMINIDWVACKDFAIEIGKRQIEEYIRTWEIHPSWLFSLEFLQASDMEYHTLYHYRARWSIPTRRNPIPKGTASVYFTIKMSKIKPQTLPVEVYFMVESNRSVHRPGQTRFREKWLADVIESKALLRSTVDF